MATDLKHTPGPWWLTERAGYYEILANSPDCDWYGFKKAHAVAYADTEIEEVEQEANARLIAASPDLLEALIGLEGILATAESNASGNPEWEVVSAKINAARAAIAKALGQ